DLVHDRLAVPRRPGARGDDEVVGSRHLARDGAEAVHRPVAAAAACEEPAVAGRRVGRLEADAPPGLAVARLVDRGPDDAGVAVAEIAQRDLVGRTGRRSQPQRRRPAELVRALEDVQLGAVVVGPVEVDRHLELLCRRHPLTEPAVRPLTIQRCRNMKRIDTGSAASSAPAVNGPQVLSYCPSIRWNMPTGRVRCPVVCRRAEAITNSFSVKTNEISATTASTGAASGSTTPQKIWAAVAPSTRADSSSSVGMVSKNPFISQACTPIEPPR